MNQNRSKALILSLSFLIPATLMAAVFALCGLCPFGAKSLGVMDMTHQYLSFLYSLRDILTGRESLFYLPSMCLGGNMTGVAAYYLMSPLNLITCLFPRERMYEAVSILYFIRIGLCGLTMSIYAGQRNGYGWHCLFSALAYSFMAYLVAYCFNYLWQDCLILLPLLALGITRITEKKGCWLYLLSLAGSLFLNFYIGYILCIFSVLFFLSELFSAPRSQRTEPARTVLTFFLSSLAAGALAAIALLPAFLSLSTGKAEFSLSVLELTAKFDFPALFSKLYPAAFNYEEIMPVGMPHIFCGTVTTALAVLYFTNSRVPKRRRILTGCLLAVLALSFWISALDLIWHCLNTPSWYNYRYSFLFSFLLTAAADRELAEFKNGTKAAHLLIPVILSVLVSLLVFIGRVYDYVSWYSALAAVAVTAVTALLLRTLLRSKSRKAIPVLLSLLLLVLHLLEMGANAALSLQSLTVQSAEPAAYAEYVSAKAEAFRLVPDDGTFTRTETTTMQDMNRCEAMLFGYDGLSHYGSTISQNSLDFLDRLGMDRYTDLWALYGTGVTAGTDSFLGVRYLVSPSMNKNYTALADANGYTVWENPYALPVAFTVDGAILDRLPNTPGFYFTEQLFHAAAPETENETLYVSPADMSDPVMENFSASGARFTRLDEGPASVTYTLTVQADGPLYGELDIPDFPGVMIFVNDAYCAYYATAQTNGTFFLGTFARGDTVTVKIQASADITLNYAAFATEDESALAALTDALRPGGCDLEKLSPSHYTGTFTTGDGDEYLLLTIPYDAAWRIRLDGQEAGAMAVQNCLMAIPVSAGEHTVELRYVPAGFIPGAVISAAAVCLCLAAFLLSRKKRH